MHTSGLILDAHDDPSVARELPDGFGEEHVKTALSLFSADLEVLPDHVFAFIRELPDGGRMRKFASVDAGTAALSLTAFLKHGHKIGHHDTWAAVGLRLRKDCLDYGLPDPAALLQEKAAGLGAAMLGYAAKNPLRTAAAAATAPSSIRGTTDSIKQNLGEVRQRERFASVGPEAKEAQHYALPSERRYPLDTYAQVSRAMGYFDEHCWSMSPEGRREYCTNVEKRASVLGLRCPEKIASYASTEYADEDHVLASLARRRHYLPESDEFLPKLASLREELSPDEFREALSAFDEAAGLDRHYGPQLPDPYLSTYGVKRASEDESFREAVGKTDTATGERLRNASINRRGDVEQVFGSDFCDRFFKNPVGTFKSLPVYQKKLLARISNDTAPRGLPVEDVSTSGAGDPTVEVETFRPPEDLTGTSAKATPAHAAIRPSTLLSHPEAHPIALDLLLLRGFGPHWLEWEPETVALRAPELKCGALSPPNFAKLQACKAMHLVDTFWLEWEVFAWLTCALDGEDPSVGVLRVPSVAQCALAVEAANQIRDDVPWSGEVRQFLAQVFRYEGLLVPPPSCAFVPVEVGDLVRVDEVRARWSSVLASGHAPESESPEDEQLRRMLDLNRDIEATRSRLVDQRRMVDHVPFRSL